MHYFVQRPHNGNFSVKSSFFFLLAKSTEGFFFFFSKYRAQNGVVRGFAEMKPTLDGPFKNNTFRVLLFCLMN